MSRILHDAVKRQVYNSGYALIQWGFQKGTPFPLHSIMMPEAVIDEILLANNTIEMLESVNTNLVSVLKGEKMKLIFCPNCQDVRKLGKTMTFCECGASGGYYLEDGLHAEIFGDAVPLGIDNVSLSVALAARPKEGMGARFTAFVIPEVCSTITRLTVEP